MSNTRALGPGTLKREQRGNTQARWVLTWTDAQGRRRRESLSSDRRVAEQIRIERIRARDLELAGLGTVDGQSRPLVEVVDAYLADLATRATAKHVINVRHQLRRMVAELGVERVRDVKAYDALRVRARLLAHGLAKRTANLHINTLRAMLGWAVSVELIAANPIARVRSLPEQRSEQRRKRRALTDEETTQILEAADEDDRRQSARVAAVRTMDEGTKGPMWALRARNLRVPQAAWWYALLGLGCRYGELRQVRWADVELERRSLSLRATTTKSGRERCIPLSEDLALRLEALRQEHTRIFAREPGRTDLVFLTPNGTPWPVATTNLMRLHERILELAGIEKTNELGETVDIHSLRHSAASRLARSGVSPMQASLLLGHSDSRTTQRHYVHLRTEDLRSAVERLSPPVLRSTKEAEHDEANG